MFAILDFGFELMKIAVLAAVYAALVYILKFIWGEIDKSSRLRRLKFRSIYFSIAGLLLVFSFTCYGDHGLGDEANIPLPHWETMDSGDGNAYFNPNGKLYDQISVDSFLVRNDHLCMASDTLIFDYQLKTSELKKFATSKLYDAYAMAHHLPIKKEFRKFWPQYNDYWSGYRFWMLP